MIKSSYIQCMCISLYQLLNMRDSLSISIDFDKAKGPKKVKSLQCSLIIEFSTFYRWWQLKQFFMYIPIPREMILFDEHIFQHHHTSMVSNHCLGDGLKYVLFSPLFGEMIQFDEHIFQMGWFNHHLLLMAEILHHLGCMKP